MREILFRGKREDNGEWIYGSVATFRNVSNELYRAIIPALDGENSMGRLKRVSPETIGQYTGLTDKNGKKIFEGDIIAVPFEEDRSPWEENCIYYDNGAVFFDEKRFGWYVAFDGDEISLWEYEDCGIVVVGNIHDNPELLGAADV